MGKVALRTIIFTDKEGVQTETFPFHVSTWAEANQTLLRWSRTAPSTGGYDKVYFIVEWEDGRQHEGRYDLVHLDLETPCLIRHIRSFAEFHAGLAKPKHLSEESYRRLLGNSSALVEHCTLLLLDHYALED